MIITAVRADYERSTGHLLHGLELLRRLRPQLVPQLHLRSQRPPARRGRARASARARAPSGRRAGARAQHGAKMW